MRWQKRTVQALNTTRQAVLGDRVRVADTGLSRIVGLLGEGSLSPGDGLLIVPSQGVHTWGMTFPIDVGVLDQDCTVIGLRPEMRPFGVTKVYWKGVYVLELPAGTLARTGTCIGDKIDFAGNGNKV